jgi:putative ABC transport system ATP-binding protein
MIHISNLSYRHQSDGPDLFHNLDLMVPSGDFVALMGASGVGKSTLLSVMAGLKTPTSGSVLLGSKDITTIIGDELSDFRATNVSMIFQSFELLDHLTVYENIELSIEIWNAKRRYATLDILDRVGLSDKAGRYPSDLSGGEQQRVGIARAFVKDAPFLLADEPTGNLDEKTAESIMSIFSELSREHKVTTVMITHDHHIASFADRIYRLHDSALSLHHV